MSNFASDLVYYAPAIGIMIVIAGIPTLAMMAFGSWINRR